MLVLKVTFRSKKKFFCCFLFGAFRVLKMEVNKEKIRYILQFFFDRGENASQAAKIVNDVYGSNTVTPNYVQFWFRRFRSGIFDVKDAPRTGRPVVENVDKIGEMIEVDRHVSSRNIVQELEIDHKTVLNHLHKAGFKKKFDVWVPHELTEKNIMDRIPKEMGINLIKNFPKSSPRGIKNHVTPQPSKNHQSLKASKQHQSPKGVKQTIPNKRKGKKGLIPEPPKSKTS